MAAVMPVPFKPVLPLLLLLVHAQLLASTRAPAIAGLSNSATVVRVGGSSAADARTVAAGIALVPDNATARWTIELEPGVYRERASTAGKGPLSLVGPD